MVLFARKASLILGVEQEGHVQETGVIYFALPNTGVASGGVLYPAEQQHKNDRDKQDIIQMKAITAPQFLSRPLWGGGEDKEKLSYASAKKVIG